MTTRGRHSARLQGNPGVPAPAEPYQGSLGASWLVWGYRSLPGGSVLQSFRISTGSAEEGLGGFWGTGPSTLSAPIFSFLSSAPRAGGERRHHQTQGKTDQTKIPFPQPPAPQGVFSGKEGNTEETGLGLQPDLFPP